MEASITPYYVYIIQCEGGSFYTGYTKNLGCRITFHMNGKGARYTRMHKAQKLVYVAEFPSISEAMRNEKRIKRLSHRQKLELTRNQTQTK